MRSKPVEETVAIRGAGTPVAEVYLTPLSSLSRARLLRDDGLEDGIADEGICCMEAPEDRDGNAEVMRSTWDVDAERAARRGDTTKGRLPVALLVSTSAGL